MLYLLPDWAEQRHALLSRSLAMDGQLAAGLSKGGNVLESTDRQAQVEFSEKRPKVVSQAVCAAV